MGKVPLKKLCKENQYGIYGIPAIAEEFEPSKTRYLRITDISDDGVLLDSDKKSVSAADLEKYILSEGDIVFARTGNSTGRTYYHEEKNGRLAFAGFLIKYALDFEKVNPKYLRYYTISREYKKWVENLSVGSTRGNINAQTFADCPISLPDRKQQDLLVSVLSALDAKIECNNRINAELEAMAKTLYDYWFVQFDFPDAAGKPYKNSGGRMVWNKEVKREIPEEWQAKRVKNIVKTALGGTPSTELADYWYNGTIHWLNSGEIANFPILSSELKITPQGVKNSATTLLPTGTTLLSITRHLRPTVLAIDACINQSVVGLRENDYFKFYFLYPYLQNEIPRLMSLRTGAQQPHINKETVDSSLIVFPPIEADIMACYLEKAKPLYDLIINNAFQNQHLTNLRDWLLPMLMNGQVQVASASSTISLDVQTVSIAAEPEAPYNKRSIPLPIPPGKEAFAKRVLGGRIVSLFKDDPHFSHIKFQKVMFLADMLSGAALGTSYYIQAAGPYDPAFMHTVADHLKASGWFEERAYKWHPLANHQKIEGYYNGYFAPARQTLEQLFSLLTDKTEEEAEIIATLYAVWNNRIILGQATDEDVLITDFYDWSERKQRYTKWPLTEMLAWMRKHEIVPVGAGKELKKAKAKKQ